MQNQEGVFLRDLPLLLIDVIVTLIDGYLLTSYNRQILVEKECYLNGP